MADSPVASTVYVINCAAPTFTPSAGTYTGAQSVYISTTTFGATIRYTIDGTTPSETNGIVYTGPVTISTSTTLQAIAYASGTMDSSVTFAAYAIQCVAPTFTPAGGTFGTIPSVTISSATNGATIRYTLDGTTPSETHGTLYSGAVSIPGTRTLKALAYASGLLNSTVTSATYTVQCATPTFSLASNVYTTPQTVSISTTTSGATIRYTTDGSTPSETNGIVYSGPLTLSTTTTLKAIAYETGVPDSAVARRAYTFQCATRIFSPARRQPIPRRKP